MKNLLCGTDILNIPFQIEKNKQAELILQLKKKKNSFKMSWLKVKKYMNYVVAAIC